MNNRIHCDKCGKRVCSFKKLKKTNSGYLCKECIRKNRKKHREFLKRDILGIRKRSDLEKEWAKKRLERERLRKLYGAIKPKIKSIKSNKKKISSLSIYITKNEKVVLYKKLINAGLSSDEANIRIKLLSNEMEKVKKELKEEVQTQEEFNKKFKEEFSKLSRSLK